MSTLPLFFLMSLASTAVPGPAIFHLSRTGVSCGFRAALQVSLGLLAADICYLLLSITGLTTILLASHQLFTLIKWLGAAYLVYLGILQLKEGLSSARKSASVATAVKTSARRSFVGGFALQVSNPKALLYFGSLVPQFVDPGRPVAPQLTTLALIHLVTAAGVFIGYSTVTSQLRRVNIGGGVKRFFNVLTGGFFIGAGASLTLLRRGMP